MKKSLLSVALLLAGASAGAQTVDPSTQRWSDSVQYVQGQDAAIGQRPSPALGAPPTVQLQQAQQQALAQQALQNQQAQNQQAQTQQAAPQADQTQTATEQTEDRPPVEDLTAQRLLWDNDPTQNLRQSGGRFERPSPRGFAASKSGTDRLRLEEWNRHLLNIGVPQSKIDFEARRLDREDFELWASRLVWWENGEHPNVVDIGY